MAFSASEKWHRRSKMCLFGFVLFTIVSIQLWTYGSVFSSQIQREMKIFSASAVLSCAILGMLCWDIGCMHPAESHNIASLLYIYLGVRIGVKMGKRFLNNFIKNAKNVQECQEKFLLDLLKASAGTAYGIDYRLGDIKSVDDFRKRHPVCTYEHYRKYVDRICDGEANVLSSNLTMFIARTSGTTGKCKYIPFNSGWQKSVLAVFPLFIYAPLLKGAKLNLQKMFVLNYHPKIETAKSGLKIGPMSHLLHNYYSFYSYPKVVADICSEISAYYVHGVFLLREPHIGSMMFGFTNQAYSFFRYLEQHWEELCHDIEHGTLKTDLDIEEDIRQQVTSYLKADKDRADFLRLIIKDGNTGLVKRVWPGLTYCRATGTGTMAVYTKPLLDSYFKGIILLSGAYGGSEGIYGMNTTSVLNDPSYSLLYQSSFFEFLPEENMEEQELENKTLLAHEVKQGCMYELIVTNSLGLYRYRVGDIVKVTSHIEKCPVVEFQYRIGQILNVHTEKTPEFVFYNSLIKAAADINVSIIDYTTCEDVYLYGIKALRDNARKYVLFVEVDKKLTTKNKLKFDESLLEEAEPYRMARKKKELFAPMEVYQVKLGTFWQLKLIMVEDNGNSHQYKMPRALRNKQYLEFLVQNEWKD